MKKSLRNNKWPIAIILVVISAVALGLAVYTSYNVGASTLNSQYSYTFSNFQGSSVPNGAAANGNVSLTLRGSWTKDDLGVFFDGNTINKQSVAYGKPSSGRTIDVAANQSVGVAARLKFQLPSNASCLKDSANITQIGKFASNQGQIKLQLSNCGVNKTKVVPQCRMAGALSTSSHMPVTSTRQIIPGETYIVRCVKSPDPRTGKTTVTMTVTHHNGVENLTTIETFQINRTGAIQSTAYLSVANKYTLPSISKNTDQFVGSVAKVAYCKANTSTDVTNCLNTEIPVEQQ